MNSAIDENNAAIEVIDDLLKHCRKMSLVKDPQKRIEFARWEIFFTDARAKAVPREVQQELSLVPAPGHVLEDDEVQHQKVAEED